MYCFMEASTGCCCVNGYAGGFALGYLLSKVLRLPERAARTNSIEVRS
jgi:hypothetical protein